MVGTLCTVQFETWQEPLTWSVDAHVVWSLSIIYLNLAIVGA